MSVFEDQLINPNDPAYIEEQKVKADLEAKLKDPVQVRNMWRDYEYKKGQAMKYLRIHSKINIKTDADAKCAETLLNKAEKWMAKAQAVLDKFQQRNGMDSNISSDGDLSGELSRN